MAIEDFNQHYSKEKHISPERQRVIDEVITLGLNTKNPLNFEDFGKKSDSLENIKLNTKTIEGLNEEEINDIKNSIIIFKQYIGMPIFTDSFHENHNDRYNPEADTRFKWEKNNLNKLSDMGRNYYESNSLGFNNIYYTMNFFDILEINIKNHEIKNKISELAEKIPQELSKRVNNILIYNTLNDSKKIEVIKQFKELIKQTIYLLSE